MKKSYLKEFQGDIGWLLLIFPFKFDAFGCYGSKTNDFPLKFSHFVKIYNSSLKLCKWDSITVEKLVFFWILQVFIETVQMG